jgi:hypothetical protein
MDYTWEMFTRSLVSITRVKRNHAGCGTAVRIILNSIGFIWPTTIYRLVLRLHISMLSNIPKEFHLLGYNAV